MPIYDINGNLLNSVTDIDSASLTGAYSIDGDLIALTPPILTLKIMSFNCQGWNGINADAELMQAIMQTHNPDIICFSEGSGAAAPEIDGVRILSAYSHSTGNAGGVNISTRIPFASEEIVHYDVQNRGDRFYRKATIPLQNGKTLALFHTHLEPSSWSAEACAAQMAALFEAATAEEYFVVTGDLNTEFRSTEDALWATTGKLWADYGCNMANWAHGDARNFVPTWFSGTTAENSSEALPLDNIIASPNIALSGVVFDRQKIEANKGLALDHIPVVATISIF